MKKLAKVFALVVLMIMGGQAMAQSRGTMFLGASFPMKDFADFDGFNTFALTSTDETSAGAGIGFNAGLKWYFNVGVEGLNVMLSVDGFYNGPNADLKNAYRNGEYCYPAVSWLWDGDSFEYNSTPKYINVPAMLGVNYIYRVNPQFAVFAEVGAGGNCRFITELETVGKSHSSTLNNVTKTTTNYDKAFSFAYQAGVGIEVAKNLVIGCSFYNLGKAEVKGEQIIKKTVNNGGEPTITEYNTYGTVHPIMVLGRIGFSF